MNAFFRKLQVSVTQQAFVFNGALALCRATPTIQHPVWTSVNERQYRSMPTNGIGRWRHLVVKVVQKKKRDKHQMKEIKSGSKTTYPTLNVKVTGYDMTLVEHYSNYIHNLCNRLHIKVSDSYALQTKTSEVMLTKEESSRMNIEVILKTHSRIIQLSSLDASICPVFMDVILKNQAEGVQLSVEKHNVDEYHARFKIRSELEGLKSKIGTRNR
ncbi:LOW QUALITY PROTEIN: 39S ribosomal protein L48, mitochondrial-like [Cottoperca gobio]|uniref:39S ribosomal protein L48, mitochondrial-like n=1 Tax=Cottoperca gobio TaxID=56716 RepID=A0A6J2RL61_COTGO|nr:39S ribosomal protein L48, mitochondrial-like [Cottoperca gobio]XP_029310700.1 LOW QUALITY PROTEIN: 39S ribosomal protein L48, mitochondrial-like [Cottoperca gobio]